MDSLAPIDGMRSASVVERRGALWGNISAGEVRWRMCSLFGGKKLRHFYFEILGPNGTGPNESIAIELVRDPQKPLLRVSENAHWGVSLEGRQLAWEVLYEASETAEKTRTIDLLSELQYMQCLRPAGAKNQSAPCVLKMVLKEGSPVSIFGGVYLKETTIGKGLRRIARASGKNVSQNVSQRQNLSQDKLPVAHQWENNFSDPEGNQSLQFSLPVGVGASVGGMLGLNVLNVASYAALLGVGFGAFAMVGIPIALALGGIVTGSMLLNQHLGNKDLRRNLGITAAEKIFEKLRCHKKFKTCGKDVLAPRSQPCPAQV